MERLYRAPGGCSEEGPHSQVIRHRALSQDLGGFLVEELHRDKLRGRAKVPGLQAASLRRGRLRRLIYEGQGSQAQEVGPGPWKHCRGRLPRPGGSYGLRGTSRRKTDQGDLHTESVFHAG